MPALWTGYELSPDKREFWAGEIAAAALELPDARRESFLAAACAGSDPLLGRVRTLVANDWGATPAAAFSGVCQPGDVVCDCFVLRPVARGGMGEVYRAIQRPVRRLVALKVVTGGAGVQPAVAREVSHAAGLEHPNVVTVYDADLDGERPCIVMEFVDGVSLRTWIDRRYAGGRGAPAADEIRGIVRQAALALGAAHRRGIVHCDVKPENILLTKGDSGTIVRLADFGIARQQETPAGPAAGTAGYMSPEQVNGARADHRADLFALGVVLYELLTGVQPFAGRSPAETYFNTLAVEPAFPETPTLALLVAVARRALLKVPEQRYQTAEAFIADLDGARDGEAEDGESPLLSELPVAVQRWWSRHRSGAALALVSFLWGCASLAASVALGAACVRVLWAPVETVRSGHEMLFGYAVEPNAGLWYVIGTSLCILTGCGFLEAARFGFLRTRTLTTADGGAPGPLARVASQNRRIFTYATPAIVALSFAFVIVPEIAFRHDHAFGWVQADHAGDHVGSSYNDLERAGLIGELPVVTSLCDGCTIRVAAVSNHPDGFAAPPASGFAVFLALALGHQVVFTSFAVWICAKLLFVFWMLSTALLGGARHGLRLVPDFQDTDDYRFGLGRMDNVYYAIPWLVAVAAIGLSLQVAANVAKGTYFFAGDPSPALFGQAVLLISTVALPAVVLLTPVAVFQFLNIKAVDAEIGRLSDRRRTLESRLAGLLASAADRQQVERELSDVTNRRATARKQSLLPIRQPAFLALLLTSLLMLLVLPLSAQWLSGRAGTGRATIGPAVCALSGNPS